MVSELIKTDTTWIYFKAYSVEPIKIEDAVTAQIRFGYMPQGYSFCDFKTEAVERGFVASWKCYSSCD